MSKVLLLSFIAIITIVSFQNCGQLKSEEKPPVYFLSAKNQISDEASINGADYYNPFTSSAIKANTANLDTSVVHAAPKTTVEISLSKNELIISDYEPSNGGNDSRLYQIKTCSLRGHRMYGYLKTEIKKIKLCTYSSTLSLENYDSTRCMNYSGQSNASNINNLSFYVTVQGLTSLSMNENSSQFNYSPDPYCDLQYTTYCNQEDDARRLKPVLDDILSEVDSGNITCVISNP